MISGVELFLYPDKQRTPEEGRRIQRPKRVTTNKDKDEDNIPKNHTQNIPRIILFTINYLFAHSLMFSNIAMYH